MARFVKGAHFRQDIHLGYNAACSISAHRLRVWLSQKRVQSDRGPRGAAGFVLTPPWVCCRLKTNSIAGAAPRVRETL